MIMEKIFKNKKLLIGCVCGVLAVALVVLLAVFVSNGPKGDKPNPSDAQLGSSPSTSGTIDTKPSESTDPTTAPTTVPPTTEPVATTLPFPSEITTPVTEGPPDDFVPTLPPDYSEPAPTKPASESSYDFGGATPLTLTLEQWNSWDMKTKQAFFRHFPDTNRTAEEEHHLQWVTQYNCYTCGFEGHACRSQSHHDGVLKDIEEGCLMCGRHDCPCLLALNKELWTAYDYAKCPYYDIKKDPSYYCQVCGYPGYGIASVGETICSRRLSTDGNCEHCGELIHVGECHHCVKK